MFASIIHRRPSHAGKHWGPCSEGAKEGLYVTHLLNNHVGSHSIQGTECRQQKAKCDSHLHHGQSCSRCQRLNLECLISGSFQRQHKRKRLTELEHEAEALRKRLHGSEPVESVVVSRSQTAQPTVQLQQLSNLNAQVVPLSIGASESRLPSYPPSSSTSHEVDDPTIPRHLNGVHLTSHEIDDLFRTYVTMFYQSDVINII